MQALRRFALRLPDTEEGVACAGTALESRTVRTRGKAFLFLRATEARLKLQASLKDAAARAAKEPGRYVVGSGGWVLVKLDDSTDPIRGLEGWIAESHALFAGQKAAGGATRGKAKTASRAKRSK
jgi:hypothetical protein